MISAAGACGISAISYCFYSGWHLPRPFGLRLSKPGHHPYPFGLSLSKPGRAGLKSMLVLSAEAGSRPACE